jgi:uncharacterized integral membrane protein (TIGR00698 family)
MLTKTSAKFRLTSRLRNSAVIGTVQKCYRGTVICALGGIAAYGLSEQYNAPVMLMALLIGLAVHFLSEDDRIAGGVEWVAKSLLRIGIALLGLHISVGDIFTVGVNALALVVIAMIVTFIVGAMLGRAMGLTGAYSRLSAGAVAVCGVSAAIAISAVLPKRSGGDKELALVIISVTALSTLAMILYPVLTSMLNMNNHAAGIFIGGSIHDVAQVVGAGYSISGEAGDTATYIKLMRVALLLPIVLLIGAASRGAAASADRQAVLPGFLIAFMILATINSLGWTNVAIDEIGGHLSRAFLVMSIFAIGMRSYLRDIFKVGFKPFMLVLAETIVMAAVVLGGLLLLGY